ncbi:MAG: helix-turn-helix domain-containing protein [Burkholderiales bacterium]
MSEEAVDYMTSTTPSSGQRLAKTREEQGLSVADVAGKLRLSPRQIEALESDDYAHLPGRTIVRGFVKNYARLLQMDQAELLSVFEARTPSDGGSRIAVPTQNVQFSETLTRHRNRATLWVTLGLLILTVVAFVLWRWEKDIGKIYTTAHGQGPGPAPLKAIPPPDVSAAIPVTPPPVLEGLPTVAPVVTTPETVTVSGASHGVHFIFEGPARVEVRDQNGRVVFNKSNVAGTVQDIAALPPLSFIVGNAAKVKMTYNGEPFDLAPHIKGSIARFKLDR